MKNLFKLASMGNSAEFIYKIEGNHEYKKLDEIKEHDPINIDKLSHDNLLKEFDKAFTEAKESEGRITIRAKVLSNKIKSLYQKAGVEMSNKKLQEWIDDSTKKYLKNIKKGSNEAEWKKSAILNYMENNDDYISVEGSKENEKKNINNEKFEEIKNELQGNIDSYTNFLSDNKHNEEDKDINAKLLKDILRGDALNKFDKFWENHDKKGKFKIKIKDVIKDGFTTNNDNLNSVGKIKYRVSDINIALDSGVDAEKPDNEINYVKTDAINHVDKKELLADRNAAIMENIPENLKKYAENSLAENENFAKLGINDNQIFTNGKSAATKEFQKKAGFTGRDLDGWHGKKTQTAMDDIISKIKKGLSKEKAFAEFNKIRTEKMLKSKEFIKIKNKKKKVIDLLNKINFNGEIEFKNKKEDLIKKASSREELKNITKDINILASQGFQEEMTKLIMTSGAPQEIRNNWQKELLKYTNHNKDFDESGAKRFKQTIQTVKDYYKNDK